MGLLSSYPTINRICMPGTSSGFFERHFGKVHFAASSGGVAFFAVEGGAAAKAWGKKRAYKKAGAGISFGTRDELERRRGEGERLVELKILQSTR